MDRVLKAFERKRSDFASSIKPGHYQLFVATTAALELSLQIE